MALVLANPSISEDSFPGRLELVSRLRNLSTSHDPYRGTQSFETATGIALSPDGLYIAWCCAPRTVAVLKCEQPQYSLSLTFDCNDNVTSLAFGQFKAGCNLRQSALDIHSFCSTERLTLAIGLKTGRIRLYSVYDACYLCELIDHRAAVRQLVFKPDGSLILLSASRDSTLKLWNLPDDCNMFKTVTQHLDYDESVTCCTWSYNCRFAASGGAKSLVFVYKADDFSIFRVLHGHLNSISDVSFSPDSALLASASFDTTVIVWNFESSMQLYVFRHLLPSPSLIYASGVNGHRVVSLSYSSDGDHLTTVCEDGFLRNWSLSRDVHLVGIAKVDEAVSASFVPDGSLICVATHHGLVNLFTSVMSVQSLRYLCRHTIRKFVTFRDVQLLSVPASLKSFLSYLN